MGKHLTYEKRLVIDRMLVKKHSIKSSPFNWTSQDLFSFAALGGFFMPFCDRRCSGRSVERWNCKVFTTFLKTLANCLDNKPAKIYS